MTVYIDLDGVCADFKGWVNQYATVKEEDWVNTDLPYRLMEEHVDEVFLVFDTLNLFPHMNAIYNSDIEAKVLTAIPKRFFDNELGVKMRQNKLKWCQKHFDNFKEDDIIFANSFADKVNYLKPGDVLYDDRKDTIEMWNQAGGVGINVEGR